MSILKRLTDEWKSLMVEYHDETLESYNETVAKGNKETFEEFKEKLRLKWFSDRMKKMSGIGS